MDPPVLSQTFTAPAVRENSMSTAVNRELAMAPCLAPGLVVGVPQFTAERTVNNRETLNTTNQEDHSFRSDFGRKTSVVPLPLRNEEKTVSAFGNGSSTKRKRGRAVKGVSEWIFPPGTQNKHDFVVSSLRRGMESKIAFEYNDKPQDVRCTTLATTNKKRGRRRKRTFRERDSGEKNMIHPIVRDAEFDRRFLRYKLSPDGEEKKDILVRSLSILTIPMRNFSQVKEALKRTCIESIPDEPSRSTSSSRIGPRYQALIPLKSRDKARSHAAVDSLVPGYNMLWDPKLADEAERRGEDISGFLAGNNELCKQELLITILHYNDYNVEAARLDLKNMYRRNQGFPTSKLCENEARDFPGLIHKTQKDISSVAKSLNRKKSDCLVHYYNWKTSDRKYQRMKKIWSDKCCSKCGELGLLMICDGCNANFHMECVTPPLTKVPEGNWFCASCQFTRRTSPPIHKKMILTSPKKQSVVLTISSDSESTSSTELQLTSDPNKTSFSERQSSDINASNRI